MRIAVVVLIIAMSARAAAQPCNHTCSVNDMNEYGCCPTPKPRVFLPPPAPPAPVVKVDAKRVEARNRLAAMAADAAKTSATDKFRQCGEGYLALWNEAPDSPDGDDVLYHAAQCFERARKIGVAIQTYGLVEKTFPKSQFTPLSLVRKGNLYASIAFYDQAATELERYASKYPDKPDTYDALSDAAFFRKATGDHQKAIADANLFIKMFGARKPADAAAAHFGVVSIYENQRDLDAALKQLRAYVQTYGEKGGADRLITAQSKIGDILWRQSCPVKGVNGLCASVTRERKLAVPTKKTKSKLPTTCGPVSATRLQVIRRSDTQLGAASAAFKAATALYERKGGKTGGFEAGALHFYAMARLTAIDTELERYLADGIPADLSFDTTDPATYKKSLKRFNDWLDKQTKAAVALRAKYEAVIAINDARAAVAASARIAQTASYLLDKFWSTPIPKMVISTGEDAIDAYCDVLSEKGDTWEKVAIDAFGQCSKKSSQLGVIDEWSELCDLELGQLRPIDAPAIVEALPAPLFATPILELAGPVVATGPGQFATAVEELRKLAATDRAACTRVAKQLTAASATYDAASAHYMAGLAYHRCTMLDEAKASYALALKSNASFVPAITNLGVLAHRSGNTDEAIKYWEAALKVDGAAVAARLDLGIAKYQRMIALPTNDRAWQKLDEDARFQFSNVLGADPDNLKAFTALALVFMQGADRNRNRLDVARLLLDEGKRVDDKSPMLHTAYGVLAMRRNQSTNALASFQTAAGDPDAAMNLALLSLRIRKYGEATRIVRSIKAQPSTAYDLQLILGVVARGETKLTDAEAAYQAAIKIDPKRPEAYFNLGVLYVSFVSAASSDLDKSSAAYQKGRDFLKQAQAAGATADLANTAKQMISDADKAIAIIADVKRASQP